MDAKTWRINQTKEEENDDEIPSVRRFIVEWGDSSVVCVILHDLQFTSPYPRLAYAYTISRSTHEILDEFMCGTAPIPNKQTTLSVRESEFFLLCGEHNTFIS